MVNCLLVSSHQVCWCSATLAGHSRYARSFIRICSEKFQPAFDRLQLGLHCVTNRIVELGIRWLQVVEIYPLCCHGGLGFQISNVGASEIPNDSPGRKMYEMSLCIVLMFTTALVKMLKNLTAIPSGDTIPFQHAYILLYTV